VQRTFSGTFELGEKTGDREANEFQSSFKRFGSRKSGAVQKHTKGQSPPSKKGGNFWVSLGLAADGQQRSRKGYRHVRQGGTPLKKGKKTCEGGLDSLRNRNPRAIHSLCRRRGRKRSPSSYRVSTSKRCWRGITAMYWSSRLRRRQGAGRSGTYI